MKESNRYHFADLDVSLPDKSVRQIAVKVADIREARVVQRLMSVVDEVKDRADPDETRRDRATRLQALREKHDLPEGTLVRQVQRVRRRVQYDQDPKQGHEQLDLTRSLPAVLPGEIRRVLQVAALFSDGNTEIFPPEGRVASRLLLQSLRARPDVVRAWAVLRIVTEEDVTSEL